MLKNFPFTYGDSDVPIGLLASISCRAINRHAYLSKAAVMELISFLSSNNRYACEIPPVLSLPIDATHTCTHLNTYRSSCNISSK